MDSEATPNSSLESDTITVLEDEREMDSDNNEDAELPPGDVYALNSRRLNATHLQCIAESLSLPTGGSMATTRQLIEGKLVELNHEPPNVQVILQGKDQSVHKIFLIDDNGIICTCTYARDHNEHVTSQPVDTSMASDPRSALRDNYNELERLTSELDKQSLELQNVTEQLRAAQLLVEDERRKCSERGEEIKQLQSSLDKERQKAKRFWRLKCDQQLAHEEALEEKDKEIARLTNLSTKTIGDKRTSFSSAISSYENESSVSVMPRRGKAPPVNLFSGDSSEEAWDDWLPTFKGAAEWNGWSDPECLLQLSGYLRGKAREEFLLLHESNKSTFTQAIAALGKKFNAGNRTLAAQDFRHSTQALNETVSDYILRLERMFRQAYGQDNMGVETRNMLLYSQLQEGLRYAIMKAPSVSGAQDYQHLCIAARNEEHRLTNLVKRQQYAIRDFVPDSMGHHPQKRSSGHEKPTKDWDRRTLTRSQPGAPHNDDTPRQCYVCGQLGHIARTCSLRKGESVPKTERKAKEKDVPSAMKAITSVEKNVTPSPFDILFSDSDDSTVGVVCVKDKGSQSRKVIVDIAGVPAQGLVDTGADITIMGPELFKKVTSVAGITRKQFKAADKIPFTYDRRQFQLDGYLNLDVTFDQQVIHTPVYIKMDAHDNLLLSEGLCRQLGIVTYHPKVSADNVDGDECSAKSVRVNLIASVRIPPRASAVTTAELDDHDVKGSFLFQPTELDNFAELQLSESLIQVRADGRTTIVLTNPSGSTCKLPQGTCVGLLTAADAIDPVSREKEDCYSSTLEHPEDQAQPAIRVVCTSSAEERKRKLQKAVAEIGVSVPWQDQAKLLSLLCDYHNIFALDEGERGETGLIQMNIDTGAAPPKRQAARRTPFAARQEIARQLQVMQEQGIIYPSSSPWASPVVLVRKKDGSLRFCIDYRQLNSVTKSDTFPLPRIDDLLDQLGEAKYFSTLDLASGYWQVQVDPQSREKTAFVTHQGLFEFAVMPFGLKNAPAVFQRLMQRVLMGLNPPEGRDFVSVYLDDVLVFSDTFESHLEHLALVLQRFAAAGLKLKPSKCHFLCQSVEYLGHLITPSGIQPNPNRVSAVKDFPQPSSIKEVRQFLGLASYYRRFIGGFAKLAHPLHSLMQKDAVFHWSPDCQTAFESLKHQLTTSPVLSYPNFHKPFRMETDASIQGLGAVLSQLQDSGHIHPVAYASRALSTTEKRYAITELETLAVVWAVSHFHAYLYGNDVIIYTDHSAVKAVLETPNPSAKHARWWSRVYGSGVRSIQIVYKPGKENLNADALSRNPQGIPARDQEEIQVVQIKTSDLLDCSHHTLSGVGTISTQNSDIPVLLSAQPVSASNSQANDLETAQQTDPEFNDLINFLINKTLPVDPTQAKKVAAQAPTFEMIDGILYFIDSKNDHRKRCVVPQKLRTQIIEENHSGPMAGHFSGAKLYKALLRHWWWPGMYSDVIKHCSSCPQCAIVNGTGRVNRPPLHPIPVQRPFQIIGVDIMDLPMTTSGNRHVVVFQDFLTKWPLAFPVPDQKAIRLVKLLTEEVIPLFGVPEALLSDRGTNLLSHLMLDICKKLGVHKLNTTAYHPQCDGMVERFNHTLKTALRKHAATFGCQWDRFLSGVLFAYRNMPHDSTGEKPSYLLFGLDCRMPTEAAYLQPSPVQLTDIQDYRQELTMSLASARTIAAKALRAAQKRYKAQYDTKSNHVEYRVGDWVLVRFPADETGRMRKLSRPWHGPYRVTALREPDISVTKVYHPQSPGINVHQSRVKLCPLHFPAGFYWYGGNRKGPGRPPKWVEQLLETSTHCEVTSNTNGVNSDADTVHDDDDEDYDVPEELTDTEDSDDISNCEEEDWSNDEGTLEPSTLPVVNRSNTHYGLRQNPRRNQRYN